MQFKILFTKSCKLELIILSVYINSYKILVDMMSWYDTKANVVYRLSKSVQIER